MLVEREAVEGTVMISQLHLFEDACLTRTVELEQDRALTSFSLSERLNPGIVAYKQLPVHQAHLLLGVVL